MTLEYDLRVRNSAWLLLISALNEVWSFDIQPWSAPCADSINNLSYKKKKLFFSLFRIQAQLTLLFFNGQSYMYIARLLKKKSFTLNLCACLREAELKWSNSHRNSSFARLGYRDGSLCQLPTLELSVTINKHIHIRRDPDIEFLYNGSNEISQLFWTHRGCLI